MIARLLTTWRLYRLRRFCFHVHRCQLSYLEFCESFDDMLAEGVISTEEYMEWQAVSTVWAKEVDSWREAAMDMAVRLGAVRRAWKWLEGTETAV